MLSVDLSQGSCPMMNPLCRKSLSIFRGYNSDLPQSYRQDARHASDASLTCRRNSEFRVQTLALWPTDMVSMLLKHSVTVHVAFHDTHTTSYHMPSLLTGSLLLPSSSCKPMCPDVQPASLPACQHANLLSCANRHMRPHIPSRMGQSGHGNAGADQG